jgi:methionyl aminopeptidase
MCEDDRVSIDSPDDLAAMRAAGRVVAEAIREMARRVRPGVTTLELDDVAAGVFARHGARSGPQLDYDFPGVTCISLDDECVHGIPSKKRRLREGQLVKLDVTAELNGYYADACRTVAVGKPKAREQRLMAAAQSALKLGLQQAVAGNNVGAIGGAVQSEVERRGFSVCAELSGHGIGRRIHEEPDVPNIAWDGPELTNGLVITVEPIITAGLGDVYVEDDGWTVRTEDGSRSAHFEHTIVITDTAPILLTA